MFKFYKALIIIHHPMLLNHLKESIIKKYQSDLKLFIDDTLKGYFLKSI